MDGLSLYIGLFNRTIVCTVSLCFGLLIGNFTFFPLALHPFPQNHTKSSGGASGKAQLGGLPAAVVCPDLHVPFHWETAALTVSISAGHLASKPVCMSLTPDPGCSSLLELQITSSILPLTLPQSLASN